MTRRLISLLALGVPLCLADPAFARDLAPVAEPVRSCPRHGPGFVQLPGTTTCVRIGGRVRSEYGTSTRRIDRDSIAGFGTSARVSVDSRTDTEYGPLRSYVRVKAGTGSGPRN